jgi:hypothetical protein
MTPDIVLAGSWRLLRWEIAYGDGRQPSFPYGEAASGLLLYASDGWMSACVLRAGRPPLSSDSVRSAPEAERLAAFESYFHYAGRYHVRSEGGRQQVVHEVEHSLNPNFVGSRQVRDIDFDAQGRLTLSASDTVPGSDVARHHRLVWQRPAPEAAR